MSRQCSARGVARSTVPDGGPPGGPQNELHKWGVLMCLGPCLASQLRYRESIIVGSAGAFVSIFKTKILQFGDPFWGPQGGP